MDQSREDRIRALLQRLRSSWAVPGWLLVVLGLAGVAGWLLDWVPLVQPFPNRAPIRPLAALGLTILGFGLLALERRRRPVALVCAALVVTTGYVGLLQIATGLDLGLEGLLRYRTTFDAAPNFRVLPLASALGFLLAGSALGVVASRWRSTAGAFAVGLIGATLVAVNLAILVGQLLGLQALQFGRLAGTSPQVALALLTVGIALASWAWHRDWTPASYPAWIPVAVGVASLATVLLLWRALIQGQRDDQQALLGAVAGGTVTRIEQAMHQTDLALWRIAWLVPRPWDGSERWRAQIHALLAETPGLLRVAWVADGRVLLLPASSDSTVLSVQLGLQLPVAATPALISPDSVRHFSLADATPTIATAIPRCDLDRCDGFVVGMVRVDRLLQPVLGEGPDGFLRRVSWRGQHLYGPRESEIRETPYRSVIPLNDMTWELAVWAGPGLRTRLSGGLPDLVLTFGLLATALLPLTLQLTRTLKANAHAAERVRLRLSLSRSLDRAWSWDVAERGRTTPSLTHSSSGQEIRRGSWTELIHPEDRRRVKALLEACLEGRTPAFEAQYRLRGAGGEWQWRVDRGHVIERNGAGEPLQMLGVSGDISERRKVEEARESSERRFRAIFDGAFHFQALLDLDGRILEANPAALRLLGDGVTSGSVQGTELWAAAWWPSPGTRERIRTAAILAREGETIAEELEVENANRERLIFSMSLKPIRDAGGRVMQLLAEGRDITAGRRAEAQLREVETLSTMGRLAARVAHEINNPLAGIQNSFLLLRDAIPPDHPHYRYVGAMEREIGRIAAVTRQLYETYRPETNGPGSTGVRTLIGDAVAFLEQVNRRSKVRIRAELESVPSQVAIPESVLRQSIYNLVQNAVEASPPGGTVTVQARLLDSTFELRVRDEGPGVPPESRRRIFQPFVSMRDRDVPTSGMGISLSMVQRSVSALGGTVDIADPPEGGAEFVVRIPVSPKPEEASR